MLALGMFMFGCLDIQFDSKQQFNEDGTSSLTVTEYVGLSKSLPSSLESMSSLTDSQDAAYFALMAMLEYYPSSHYSGFFCGVIGDAVDNCVAKNDGAVKIETKLSPGEFYSFEKQTDWLSLKERRTYTINEVPSASYYAGMQDPTYDEAMVDDMKAYFEKNADRFLTTDSYCSGGYSLTCEVLGINNDLMTISLGSSYTPRQIMWAGCSDIESTSFLFLNESEAKDSVSDAVTLGSAVSGETKVTFNAKCPAGTKSLVVGYRSKSYSGGYTNVTVDALDIISKDEMKDKALENFDVDDAAGSFGSFETPTAEYEESVLSFKEGMALGHDFSRLEEFAGSQAEMLQMDVSIDYEAEFPNTVLSATAGGEDLKVEDNKVELSIDDLKDMDSGALVVVTEKELSPLGMFTWAIPVVFFGLILLVVLFKVLRG
jgi:hypothetical protein